jgi:hypothetical protein
MYSPFRVIPLETTDGHREFTHAIWGPDERIWRRSSNPVELQRRADELSRAYQIGREDGEQ